MHKDSPYDKLECILVQGLPSYLCIEWIVCQAGVHLNFLVFYSTERSIAFL